MTIPPLHAWTLRRLLTGQPVNGELQDLPERFQPIGRRLNGLPSEARSAAWEAFLDGQDDRVGIIESLTDADPEGPTPEPPGDDDESGDDWGPIRLGTLPPAEPFPVEILPLPARHLAEAAAQSIGCPVDFPAVAALVAASGLIGRSASLLIKPGYFESASLYVAIVGSPSSGKSPALRTALTPIRKISGELYQDWRIQMDAFEVVSKDKRGFGPVLQRIDTTDPTTEALGPILALGPRGLLLTPDEMTNLVMSMDQYKGGKGGDRPFYLSVWSGEAVMIDRAKFMREPIRVPHPFLTIVGGMTPGMLSELAEGKGREDGFTARLLFSYPDRVSRPYTEAGIPEAVAEGWHELARSLWNRKTVGPEDSPTPHVVKMTHNAKREWREWCQAHRDEQEADEFPDSLEGPWGKLEAYAARLALVLHLMDLAADPTEPADRPTPELSRAIITKAAALVAYFKSHAKYAYSSMGGQSNDGGEDVRTLLGWIRRSNLTGFSERDASRGIARFKDDPSALTVALGKLITRKMIRPRKVESKPGPGRKPSPSYEVSPALKKRSRNSQN